MGILQKALQWFLIIFTIYVIIEVIRKIFGGSLGFEELVVTLLGINIGYSFYLNSRISDINHRLSEQISEVNSKLSEHFGWHKGKTNSRS